MPPALPVPPLAARRFQLRAVGLEQPFASTQAALEHLGYVQIDPLNICGRMHDLILRNRVAGYREGDLMRHLHEDDGSSTADGTGGRPDREPPIRRRAKSAADRIAFEHHHPETHVLMAFPLEAWPHLLGAMRGRAHQTSAWSGRLTPTERALAPRLLAEIARRGPLSSEDFDDDRKSHRIVWGAATLVKSTLQKLFFHGRLLIAERHKNRRRYDLPERVLPAAILARSEAPAAETLRWISLLKLRQRRLVTLRREELRAVADAVQPVAVENCPPLYCLREDVPLLEACVEGAARAPAVGRTAGPGAPGARSGTAATAEVATGRSASGAPATDPALKLLAPLDPLIYDRRVTALLWNFDYTWEAYTPPAKRVRGHYALPVLAGTELVGHVEPKADREHGKLVVASRSVRRGHRVGAALDELAAWLGLRR